MQLTNIKHAVIGLAIISVILSACSNSNPKKEQEDLQKAVIAAHDTVMKDMSAVMNNKMQINHLLSRLDSLKAANPTLDTVEIKNNLTQAKSELEAADEAMMDWMHNFSPDYEGKSRDEIINYLNDQKEKINILEKSFKSVIIKSDSVIKNLNQ